MQFIRDFYCTDSALYNFTFYYISLLMTSSLNTYITLDAFNGAHTSAKLN